MNLQIREIDGELCVAVQSRSLLRNKDNARFESSAWCKVLWNGWRYEYYTQMERLNPINSDSFDRCRELFVELEKMKEKK